MYPRLNIDIIKLNSNAHKLTEMCKEKGVSVMGVTKVVCADKRIVDVMLQNGFKYFADSRLENFMKYPKYNHLPKVLLRLPMISEAEKVVEICDISLNSEIATITRLGEAAAAAGKTHGILLMIDLGDLREGIYYTNEKKIIETAKLIKKQKFLDFSGVGVNLTCYGSVLPSETNMQKLVEISQVIEKKTGLKSKIISGGNSSSLSMAESGKLPKEINNLRIGEALIRGVETAYGKPFHNLHQNIITLDAEIIEIYEKPSLPEGETGVNAFGEKITYVDKGKGKRAILALGRQDIVEEGITPLIKGLEIIGVSSDHLIMDINKAEVNLAVGDIVPFSLSYGAILAAFTSGYVKRNYIG